MQWVLWWACTSKIYACFVLGIHKFSSITCLCLNLMQNTCCILGSTWTCMNMSLQEDYCSSVVQSPNSQGDIVHMKEKPVFNTSKHLDLVGHRAYLPLLLLWVQLKLYFCVSSPRLFVVDSQSTAFDTWVYKE